MRLLQTLIGIMFLGTIVALGYAVGRSSNTRSEIEPALLDPNDSHAQPLHRHAIVDPHVRPASATALLYVAPLAIGQSSGAISWQVTQGEFIWPKTGSRLLLLKTEADFALHVGGDKPRVFLDGDEELAPDTIVLDPANNKWKASVGFALPSARRIQIEQGSQVETLIVAPPQPTVRAPSASHISNNVYKVPEVFNPQAGAPTSVYNRYLRLKGFGLDAGTELRFYVFEKVDSTLKLLSVFATPLAAIQPAPNGAWEAELRMPPPEFLKLKQAGAIAMAAVNPNSGHRFSEQLIHFSIEEADEDLLKALTLLPDTGAGKPVKNVANQFYSNEPSFNVTINPEGATSEAHGEVVMLLGERRQPVRPPAAKSGNAYIATVTVDGDGPHELRAGWAFGDKIHKQSKPITVHVRTQAPSPSAIEPLNFASTPGSYKITIRFDSELASSVTTNHATKFFLYNSNGTAESFATENPATLSGDAKSLILSFAQLTPDNYELHIPAASIVDRFGNQLAEEIRTSILNPIGGETPTISRGISGPTGKYVEFPEYTDPRPFVEGFNPSDRVETRVSRLYYYRDAHRVAQIINRNVQSYNRAAVDMAEQRADKSRQLADQATDDRRIKERNAILAAQKTREAEQEFQQAQTTAERLSLEAATALEEANRLDAQRPNPPAQPPSPAETDLDRRIAQARSAASSLDNIAGAARQRAAASYDKVQRLREEEAQTSEEWQRSIATEDRAREEQFRREVAAARADPDTYVPGRPTSTDPVEQVSVSVIGEGLIQLRGPIKGINNIRTMINQIDAPVGQVRVGVHTVQINGEKGDRMEKVAGKIQRYIDHSRFLTLQSAEMLRKAIVQVAAQRAMEAGNVPGLTQAERDRSYLFSFFGEDFIRELEAMDSEFLGTGNKLLSIHSMDSTSLASAMFVMGLAKNTTRMQILQTFEGMMAGELPMAEQNYFEAGLTCDGKEKLFGKYCNKEEFALLSENARFQSIRGMFNAELGHDDTMTPIQREFVRLAQIFKSRLIVEMELKQRVMERSVIEERLGNRLEDLRKAQQVEQKAAADLALANNARRDAQKSVLETTRIVSARTNELARNVANVQASIQTAKDFSAQFATGLRDALTDPQGIRYDIMETNAEDPYPNLIARSLKIDATPTSAEMRTRAFLSEYEAAAEAFTAAILNDMSRSTGEIFRDFAKRAQKSFQTNIDSNVEIADLAIKFKARWGGATIEYMIPSDGNIQLVNESDRPRLERLLNDLIPIGEMAKKQFSADRFSYPDSIRTRLENADSLLAGLLKNADMDTVERLKVAFNMITEYGHVSNYLDGKTHDIARASDQVVGAMISESVDVNQTFQQWLALSSQVQELAGPSLSRDLTPRFEEATGAFRNMLKFELDYQFAVKTAEASRRPLDHKKFLDMLVDEMEDKYIELLEGTRAHTANIDAYIKRLMTSLDDDFNTQFYYPTFRKVREASQLWDVQMGQVETTNVLANNRAFAKVSPEATMEFDLPKRDILIAEAMDGAKAMIDDFGALAQDPTFLAMAKLGSGSPTSTQLGGASGGQSAVRNVLPGLSTDTAESVMSQHGPGGTQFGAALENLIPDPAIYKFETGTGWEIRPVIQPDGQALVFHFNYMYTTNVREPVRADEKHLGRVKRHFVDTDVQLSNFELREISRYTVALKASRTSRGVPLFEDIPVVGALFRPLPSDESSLQQNVILGQATIFPTVFDLMGLRWAPVVADLDPLRLSNDEFIVRNRRRALTNRVFDHSSSEVDKFLRIPDGERRMDLYRSQETIPSIHPNGYQGPGANLRDSQLQEGYDPTRRPESQFVPSESSEGSPYRRRQPEPLYEVPLDEPQATPGDYDRSSLQRRADVPLGVANVAYRAHAGAPRYPGQQAEYVTAQPSRTESPAPFPMQRLPTVDGSPRPLPGQIIRPITR